MLNRLWEAPKPLNKKCLLRKLKEPQSINTDIMLTQDARATQELSKASKANQILANLKEHVLFCRCQHNNLFIFKYSTWYDLDFWFYICLFLQYWPWWLNNFLNNFFDIFVFFRELGLKLTYISKKRILDRLILILMILIGFVFAFFS